jgi:transposase
VAAVAGLDWASTKHDVCVCDEQTGQVLVEDVFGHSEAGIARLCRALIDLEVVRVAIERPDGLLVERLVEAGLVVMAIHPNQVAAARERFRAAAGKTDRFDAMVLCELARTDHHRFALLRRDSDQLKALKALTRAREDLVQTRVALSNQLRGELERFWPGPIGLFNALDSEIALAFLAKFPTPHQASKLTEPRLQRFLDTQRYPGRQSARSLLAKLAAAPQGTAGAAETAAHRQIVLALVATLRPLVRQIRELTAEIARSLDAHPDGPIFRSFFKSPDSVVCAATLLAEIGDNRDRYPTADALAADAGMTPIAIESGKRKHAAFRRACDHRLRDAFCVLANSTRHWHPVAQDRYSAARMRGHDHPRALRTVGRCWTRVIYACWKHHQPYDPLLHTTLQNRGG